MVLGKAWTSIPCSKPTQSLQNPLLLWFRLLENIFQNLIPGSIVVIASDTILDIPSSCDDIDNQPTFVDWKSASQSSVVALAVPATLEVAKNHGVFVPGNSIDILSKKRALSPCLEIYQKAPLNVLKGNCSFEMCHLGEVGTVAWIDTGVICFLPMAAQSLRNMLVDKPACETLRCTKRGLVHRCKDQTDSKFSTGLKLSNGSALSIDLYTHFLNALRQSSSTLSSAMDFQSYYSKYKNELPHDVASLIFQALSQMELIVWTEPLGAFLHLGTTRELVQFLTTECYQQDELASGQRATLTSAADQLRANMASRLGLCTHLKSVLLNVVSLNGNEEETIACQPPPSCVVCESFFVAKNGLNIGKGAVIEHSVLFEHGGSISIGDECLVSGLRSRNGQICNGISIPSKIMIQEVSLASGEHVYMVLGIDDGIKTGDTIYGRPLGEFLSWGGLQVSSLWPDPCKHQLWEAKIHPIYTASCGDDTFMSYFGWLDSFRQGGTNSHPSFHRWKSSQRLSLADIRENAHAPTEFDFRNRLKSCLDRISGNEINTLDLSFGLEFQEEETFLFHLRRVMLLRQNEPVDFSRLLRPIHGNVDYRLCIDALHCVDQVIVDAFQVGKHDICGRGFQLQQALMEDLAVAPWIKPSDLANREKALVELLSNVTGTAPSQDQDSRQLIQQWSEGLVKMMDVAAFNVEHIWDQFADTRDAVLKTNPNLLQPGLINTAGHFARIMTRMCVAGDVAKSALIGTDFDPEHLVLNRWMLSTAPARIDLAGGWSDTPPICIEFGSSVTGLAVSVDGKRPLACRSRLLQSSTGVLLKSEHRNLSGKLLSEEQVDLISVDEVKGYNIPSATCSLLKCCLVVLGLVTASEIDGCAAGEISLSPLVASRCCFDEPLSLQVIVTSMLPHGSGMGSSSILAGCVLSSIASCLGIKIEHNELFQYVIAVEQQLTTGGGFQDQVNGLVGGAKIVSCEPLQFPLSLSIEPIELETSFQKQLDKNLILVFTGQTRLAKNILQQCLRRWASRSSEIVENVQHLVENAHRARECLLASSLPKLGRVLSLYWEQKKIMAGDESGVEPAVVSQICRELIESGVALGGSLCGAGGGGFLVLLKSEEADLEDVLSAIHKISRENCAISTHTCAVSNDGIAVVALPEMAEADVNYFDSSWLDA